MAYSFSIYTAADKKEEKKKRKKKSMASRFSRQYYWPANSQPYNGPSPLGNDARTAIVISLIVIFVMAAVALIVYPFLFLPHHRGKTGHHCWDLNHNRKCDLATEDINNDNECTVLDCKGEDGIQGIDGADGIQGQDGAQGSDGQPGMDGSDGIDGSQGPPGPIVPIGNLTDVNITNIQDCNILHYNLTTGVWENIFLESLINVTVNGSVVGPPGPAGMDGLDGMDGMDGADGLPGPPGSDGLPGPLVPLGNLTDVNITNPLTCDVLHFENNIWVNRNITELIDGTCPSACGNMTGGGEGGNCPASCDESCPVACDGVCPSACGEHIDHLTNLTDVTILNPSNCDVLHFENNIWVNRNLTEIIDATCPSACGNGTGSGFPGPPGSDGSDGVDGLPGSDGIDGKDGLPGPPGNDGIDGLPGPPGSDGIDGLPGSDGVDGLPGPMVPLGNLTDVNITNPETCDVLHFENNTWVNRNITELVDTTCPSACEGSCPAACDGVCPAACGEHIDHLTNLTDVTILNPGDCDVLHFENNKWINRNITELIIESELPCDSCESTCVCIERVCEQNNKFEVCIVTRDIDDIPTGVFETICVSSGQVNSLVNQGHIEGTCPCLELCPPGNFVNMTFVCHVMPQGQNITLELPTFAVLAHLAHGDFLGPCPGDEGLTDECSGKGNMGGMKDVDICLPPGHQTRSLLSRNMHKVGAGDKLAFNGTHFVKESHQVIICHVRDGQPPITISVSPMAVNAHLGHGDSLGECGGGVGGECPASCGDVCPAACGNVTEGPPGADGSDGVDGSQGIPGINGTDGSDGVDGNDGLPGINGTNGSDGIDGNNGIDGINGTDGTNGIDGSDGEECWDINGNNVCDLGSPLQQRHDCRLDCCPEVANITLPGKRDISTRATAVEIIIGGSCSVCFLLCDVQHINQYVWEDTNEDGACTAADCQGNCWDLNGNNHCDNKSPAEQQSDCLDLRPVFCSVVPVPPSLQALCTSLTNACNTIVFVNEDINNDGFCTAEDCQGVDGEQGPAGPIVPIGDLTDVTITDLQDCNILHFNVTTGAWENVFLENLINITDNGMAGPPGAAGIHCWDLNQNGFCDPIEDVNEDGNCDVLDCQTHCWDLNGNGICDHLTEDINLDGACNVTDCLGATGSNGSDGIDGNDGSQGIPGINGTDGSDGVDGSQGIPGINGTDGSDGIDGSQGIAGEDGSDGSQGINGTDGSDGVDGSDGSQGINGTDGTDGVDGSQGIPGINGTDGSDGVDGSQGPPGPIVPIADLLDVEITNLQDCNILHFNLSTGAWENVFLESLINITDNGVVGPPGPAGIDGVDGVDGLACWDLNGNGLCDPLTEDKNNDTLCTVLDCQGVACWDLNSNGVCDLLTEDINLDFVCNVLDCAGPQGPQGTDGIDGMLGLPGDDGIDGSQGIPGINGTDGTDGVDGSQGIPGINGTDGVDGSDGSPGTPGINGTDGVDGVDGSDGSPGTPGINGTDGSDGVDGSQGIQGINGTDGIDGADGSDGSPGTPGINGTDGVDGSDGLPGPIVPIGDLTDVEITDLQDCNILHYNISTGVWENIFLENLINITDNGMAGPPGAAGIHCWDLNSNGFCDLVTEDINLDGACNVTDCLGATGTNGIDGIDGSDGINGTNGSDGSPGTPGTPGTPCWDIVVPDGLCDLPGVGGPLSEDKNKDGICDALDCQAGTACWDTITPDGLCDNPFLGGPASEDKNMDGFCTAADCQGVACWDLNGNFACDPAEDTNGDTFCTIADCQGAQGINGTTGSDGSDGSDGLPGDDGSQGIPGTNGTDGSQGIPGSDGSQGINGTDGTDGVDGSDGAIGFNGTDGVDGIHCWDLNSNGACDLGSEDITGDGFCTVDDCLGPAGINRTNGIDGSDGATGATGSCSCPSIVTVSLSGPIFPGVNFPIISPPCPSGLANGGSCAILAPGSPGGLYLVESSFASPTTWKCVWECTIGSPCDPPPFPPPPLLLGSAAVHCQ